MKHQNINIPNCENILSINSCPTNIAKVEELANEIKKKYSVDESIYGNILISITEAVSNAIIHGNQRNAEKEILICHQLESKQPKILSIKVKDEGKGFDYNNLPDPTAPENIALIGGRGLFLIKQLSDLVIFSNQGETIEMQFKI